MIFQSAELRWFFDDLIPGEKIYKNSFPEGFGHSESLRSDHYLKLKSLHSGIKIRQGNHEIKLLSSTSKSDWGTIEMWTKWSYQEDANILEQIKADKLEDWLEIRKKRWIKKYRINSDKKLIPITDERVEQGCGFELTKIEIPTINHQTYTIGLEAFSSSGHCLENLMITLENLKLRPNAFEKFNAMSYPGYITSILR
jgi:hypothetical protein